MKKKLYTRFNQQSINLAILLIRVCIGVFMLTHGIPKFAMLFESGSISFPDPFGIGAVPTLIVVVLAEVFGSIFIMLGLWTRIAAIPLIINMSVASFLIHSGESFSGRELAMLYLLVYIILLTTGSGKFSIDHYLFSKNK